MQSKLKWLAWLDSFSTWGVTGKIFGFLLAYNWSSRWYALVRVGTRWSLLASLGKRIHRQHLTQEVRGAESILQAKAANF